MTLQISWEDELGVFLKFLEQCFPSVSMSTVRMIYGGCGGKVGGAGEVNAVDTRALHHLHMFQAQLGS